MFGLSFRPGLCLDWPSGHGVFPDQCGFDLNSFYVLLMYLVSADSVIHVSIFFFPVFGVLTFKQVDFV